MKSERIKDLENTYVADTYARYDVALVKGLGARCWDAEGKEYLDFTSGIGVNALGYSDPGWVHAIENQASKIQHTSNLFYTEPCALAAEKMIKLSGMCNMFFCNSGAEANEGAIKTARKYSLLNYGEQYPPDAFDRYEIITLDGSFHGRTIATITATGQDSFHKYFSPFLQGFRYCKANDINSLHETVTEKTCAIMIEFIQGEGGVNDLTQEFVDEIARVCRLKDILLIADEVQTGVARTGEFMAYNHFDVKPDIVTAAKGMGGGLPIGGILFGEKTKNVLGHGDHGSTFGGNPVVCAGADYVLSKIDGDFLSHVRQSGEYFKQRLEAMDGVSGVSGIGLMIGVGLKDKTPAAVVNACLKSGLLLLTAKDKLRLLPPLIISRAEIDEGLDILEKTLKE
ncbi:MAG: aspartate aminotransferase family protein [Clostridiales Family XIII bacterium]|nr:aspartate aminotransferase family protein [Clostridiales Family XIII bacterium]